MSVFETIVSIVAFVALGIGYACVLSDADMKKYRKKWKERQLHGE